MRAFKKHRVVLSVFHPIIRQRLPVCLLLFTILVTACVAPPKPVPTQESQEAAPPPAETAEISKPTESVPAESPTSSPEPPVIPFPPVGGNQPESPSTQEETPVLEAEPVMVTAQRDAYTVTRATTATKTDTPIMETPVSVQVVPRAVMEDQKSSPIKDALENVSNVRPQPSLTPSGSNFLIRGFPSNFRVYRNGLGLINGFGGLSTSFDTANLESVEVLKGPAAVLFGRIEPGGLINLTTKPALSTPSYALEQQFGSYNHYRTLWDAGGAVTDDRSLRYRFAGAYQNSESFRDFVFVDRLLVSPTLSWRPWASTDMTLNIEGLDEKYKADFGLPVIGTRPAPIPVSRSFGDPNTPPSHNAHIFLNTTLTHRFNESWALHNRFLAAWAWQDSTFVNPAPAFGDALRADHRTLDRNIFFQEDQTDTYTTNLDLTGTFQVWSTRHEVLVGFDYTRGRSRYQFFGDYNNPNPALAIDIFNPGPSYGIPASVFASTLATRVGGPMPSVAQTQWYGVYFQDHVTLWDRFHILGGGRYDWAEFGRGFGSSFEAAAADLPSRIRKDERFSPRVGILYQAWDWLSVYGNWTNALGANNGISSTGLPHAPEIGEQFEAGIKTALFHQRLLATVAFYHITKRNVLTPDLSTPDPLDRIAIGKARSRGIELDVSGQLTENVSVIATYAHTDAQVIRDDSGLQGNRLNNVPRHAGSLWLKYTVTQLPPLNGLSLGIGVYAASQREGDAENTFQLPGYARLDAFAAYRWLWGPSRLIAQINARNILDQKYYESTDPFNNVAPRLGVYPGAPLTLIGSLRWEY